MLLYAITDAHYLPFLAATLRTDLTAKPHTSELLLLHKCSLLTLYKRANWTYSEILLSLIFLEVLAKAKQGITCILKQEVSCLQPCRGGGSLGPGLPALTSSCL